MMGSLDVGPVRIMVFRLQQAAEYTHSQEPYRLFAPMLCQIHMLRLFHFSSTQSSTYLEMQYRTVGPKTAS